MDDLRLCYRQRPSALRTRVLPDFQGTGTCFDGTVTWYPTLLYWSRILGSMLGAISWLYGTIPGTP